MGLRPRECFTQYHLIILTGLVATSLLLIVIGGSLSGWCIRYGTTFECYSLFYSERAYSCFFKLIPTGVVFSLILSIFMFIVLIIGHVYAEYTGIAKKEYQDIARFVNIFALSAAIVLIMIVLLQWYQPPANASKKIIIAMIRINKDTNSTSKSKEEEMNFIAISPDNPSYLEAIGANRRPMTNYHPNLNHGPNLFFAAFIIVFVTLLIFVLGHRM